MTWQPESLVRLLATTSIWAMATVAVAAEQPAPAPGPRQAFPTSGHIAGVAAPTTSPVTTAMLNAPPPADWLMWRRTLDSWGYSPLTQINARNAKSLQLAWVRPLGPLGKQEGTPLVHEGVMYMPIPYDGIQALKADTGDLIWEYRRPIPADVTNYMNNPDINRNIAIFDNLIINTSADDHIYALDKVSGKVVWETLINDYHQHAGTQSSGPIIADGKVISGRACEPEGGPDACVIVAHDARTGKELWRTRTIPRPGEPGGESWGDLPDEARWHVGAWMPSSYDPELKLIYMGTSVTSPAPKFAIAGNDKAYLHHNSTLALDVETGRIVWAYQHVVDHWDLDHPFERLLMSTAVSPDPKVVKWINPRLKPGERRKVVTGIPGKTGLVYTLDAKTGEFLWATSTVYQNVIQGIDGATGKVTVNPESIFQRVGQELHICPNAQGGKNWPAGSYSPATGLMYMPLQNTCADITPIIDKPSLSSLYGYRLKATLASGPNSSPNPNVGSLWAISASTGGVKWKYEQRAAMLSLVATAGGLIFAGDTAGQFRAFDERDGKILWETRLGAPVAGYPVSFAVNGKQYVAASTGASLSAGSLAVLTPELRMGALNALFVFALPD